MKNSILLLLLFIGLSNHLISQTQISNLDYQVPTPKYTASGIENINGIDYLIESNSTSLRVSTVKDSIEVLYEVSDYPSENDLKQIYTSVNSRSKHMVEGIYLYEVFGNQIRKRNILTSNIEDTYSFPDDKIRFLYKMEFTDEFIHLDLNTNKGYATYNLITKEFTSLPLSYNKIFRDGDIYYESNQDFGIKEYNAKTGNTNILFENEENTFSSGQNSINGQKGMIFGGPDRTRFVNSDTTFLLDCNFYDENVREVIIHDTPTHYIAFYNKENEGEGIAQIVLKFNCTELSSTSFATGPEEFIKVFDHPTFTDDYLLIHLSYVDFYTSGLLLLDKNTFEISTIEVTDYVSVFENSFYRSENKIYFLGQLVIDFEGINRLYSLNLETQEFNTSVEDFSYRFPISFGPLESDSTLVITRGEDLALDITKFKDDTDTEFLYSIKDTRNAGFYSIEHLAVKEEKLVFKFKDNIYLADNFSSTNDKTSLITQADQSTKLVMRNGGTEGIVTVDESYYHLMYDFDSEQLTLNELEENLGSLKNSTSYTDYIFGDFSKTDKIFFDLNTKKLETIPVQGDILSMYQSHKNMLFLSSCDLGYCFTSFSGGEFIDSQISFQNQPKVFSKGNGEYMIVELMEQNKSQLSIIKADGTVGSQMIVDSELIVNSTVDKIEEGPLSALMFYNTTTENLVVIMHRYTDFHSYTIPFIYAQVSPLIWYKASNSIILKSDDDDKDLAGIYICTLGEEVKKIQIDEMGDRFHDLIYASQDEEKINFVLKVSGRYEVFQYDTETNSLENYPTELNSIRYYEYSTFPIFRISPSLFYITYSYQYYYDEYENGELYVFNSEDKSFQVLTNLNQRDQQSNPHQFIESPSFLYFIARSPSDNSYQLFSQPKETIVSVNELNKNESLVNLYPNPSTDYISIDSNADNVIIMDAKGQSVKSIRKHSKNEQIDISALDQGVYFIELIKNNAKITTRFIKI